MRFKSQSNLMEYLLLIFFVVFIIVALILFITWWQVTQLGMKKSQEIEDRALSLTKEILINGFFVKEESVFDDGKLTAANTTIKCEELKHILGEGWFMKIKTLDENVIPCNEDNYPDCNYWEFCVQDNPASIYAIPVNIYRRVQDRYDLGVLYVGVYYEKT